MSGQPHAVGLRHYLIYSRSERPMTGVCHVGSVAGHSFQKASRAKQTVAHGSSYRTQQAGLGRVDKVRSHE